jgi:hypothetical protein
MEQPETGRQMDLLAICESMKANADEVARAIVDRWLEIIEAEPWQRLPEGLDFNHLPRLIRDLAGAALCTEFDRGMCATLVRTSAQHGQHRAEEGLGEELIFREYHLLRRALWRQMKADHGENATVYYATMRVDALVSLASSAALHGMNRDALIEQGVWPQVLDDLLDDWPLPAP